MTGMRLVVDPVRCDGLGYCAELCPELIDLDDWGFPMIQSGATAEGAVLRHARRAVAQCPRVALALLPSGVRSER